MSYCWGESLVDLEIRSAGFSIRVKCEMEVEDNVLY